jgi:hypothetical protein
LPAQASSLLLTAPNRLLFPPSHIPTDLLREARSRKWVRPVGRRVPPRDFIWEILKGCSLRYKPSPKLQISPRRNLQGMEAPKGSPSSTEAGGTGWSGLDGFLRTLQRPCVPYTFFAYPVPGPQTAAPAPTGDRPRCGMPPGHVTCVPCSGLAYPIPFLRTLYPTQIPSLGGPPRPQTTPTATQVAHEPQVFVPHPNPSPQPNPNPVVCVPCICFAYPIPGSDITATAPGAGTGPPGSNGGGMQQFRAVSGPSAGTESRFGGSSRAKK